MRNPSLQIISIKIILIIFFILFFNSFAFGQFNISKIVVSGNSNISSETIKALSGLSTKKTLSAREINNGFRRLSDSGLFQDVKLNPVGNRLIISVIENPLLDAVTFEGNKIFKTPLLNRVIKSKPRSAFNRGTIDEDVRQLLQLYREKGRFGAKISPKKVLLVGNRLGLVFEIDEGPRTEIKTITFIGNKSFSDARSVSYTHLTLPTKRIV